MPGPQKQFDRHEVLAKCMSVFWNRGYAGTNFDHLVAATGVNRSSIYATFGDKESLFEQALQLYVDRGLAVLTDLVRGQGSPLLGVENALRFIEDEATEKSFAGCLCGNSSAELASDNPAVARVIKIFYARFEILFLDALQDAIAAEELSQDTDAQYWARLILVVTQGVSNVAQGGLDPQDIHNLFDGLLRALKT